MAFGNTLLALILGACLISALPGTVVTPNELLYSARDGGIKLLTVDAGSGKSMYAHTLSCYCYYFRRQLDTFLVPGWPQIVQYAKDTYGDDGLTYKVNPPGQPDYQAVVCTDQEQLLLISMQGASSCSTRNDTVAGSITGTTGSVTLSHIDTYTTVLEPGL
ncbi:uncharacterized protein LACBIDRAFT_308032 [Laccaria bicolor S238N-H82]|uniref:Predicted protein n=1 Tax=Laccaria bicolor (strain S238N-H82 / ATCC MYA-4686) TaxID=486041 RepID=B0DRG9_LACBS|nr:uncharacterized protein LACBIDRAFT_308032 [Laccaria bicolor S238N-H82]EDR02782.1 predicted protein [Laccaria bicolor S238N-H82]|eukprot:XP_001886492.1 predicted protein [Laccaria bicolor S238N-H82]